MEKMLDEESVSGLSEEDAEKRIELEGYNELPSQKRQNIFSILLNVILDPMLLLLLGAGSIYLLSERKTML